MTPICINTIKLWKFYSFIINHFSIQPHFYQTDNWIRGGYEVVKKKIQLIILWTTFSNDI
jgi:hypothetical protein